MPKRIESTISTTTADTPADVSCQVVWLLSASILNICGSTNSSTGAKIASQTNRNSNIGHQPPKMRGSFWRRRVVWAVWMVVQAAWIWSSAS